MMLRITPATVANKPGTPGRARISREHHRTGNAGCFGVPVVTNLRVFYFYTQGCGCVRAPAFPVPSLCEGHDDASPGRANAPRECGVTSSIPEAARLEHRRLWNTGSPGHRRAEATPFFERLCRATTPSGLFDM
jgi:hypothetical protein